jgi:hypothetical protein
MLYHIILFFISEVYVFADYKGIILSQLGSWLVSCDILKEF